MFSDELFSQLFVDKGVLFLDLMQFQFKSHVISPCLVIYKYGLKTLVDIKINKKYVHVYRITAAMKVETDIITCIAATNCDTCDNVCRDLQS